MTEEELYAAIDGMRTYRRDGEIIPYKLNAGQKKEFEAFIKKGYGYAKTRAFVPFEKYCLIQNLPIVSIRKKVKYAVIIVDMPSCGCLNDIGEYLLKCCFSAFTTYRHYIVGANFGSCHKIPVDFVERVADNLVEITRDERFLIDSSIPA